MNRIKKEGANGYAIFDETGKLIAYLQKNCFGTHGHWRGWRHYCYCEQLDEMAWAGAEIPIDGKLCRWTDAPMIFINLNEAKSYYQIN